jgi:uncharacterized protein YkwD
MVNFSSRKISRSLFFGFMAISLATTSLGTALTTTTYAATTDNTQQVDNNRGSYGLIALGLLAALSSHGHSNDNVAAKTSSSSATVSSNTSSAGATISNSSLTGTVNTSSTNAAAAEQQAVSLLNADRRANGLPDLQVDSRLTTLAQNYAQDMINRNYFSHTNPEGQSPFDRMKQAGISYSYAGENIAMDQNVQSAEIAFMNDSDHRANILSANYTTVGIGVAYDKNGNVYVVQDFIKP